MSIIGIKNKVAPNYKGWHDCDASFIMMLLRCILGLPIYGNSKLSEITLTENIQSIGDLVFGYCSNLININVVLDNQYYKSMDGNIYTKDGTTYVNLVGFIIANSIIKDIRRKRNGEDYPIYICDAFNKLSEEQIKTVMTLIKDMGKQVFIILREPNELVSSCSDKSIEYYYNPDKKIDKEELPF